MTHIQVNLPDALAERLHRIAEETNASAESLVIEAVGELVAAREDIARMIAQGVADIEAGRVVAHDEVMREMKDWAAAIRARHRA